MQPTQACPWRENYRGKLPISATISQAEQKEMQLVVRLSQIDSSIRRFFLCVAQKWRRILELM